MQVALDVLRGLLTYVLVVLAGGAILWIVIPGFGGPVSPEMKLRAFTAVFGGGALFAVIVVGAVIITINWR